MNKNNPYSDQIEAHLFTLENDYLKVTFSNYGCMLKSLIYKPLNRETVLGLDTYAEDVIQTYYLGSLVGRTGNRIAYGRFDLNGQTYTLPINNGVHHLHGGTSAFDKQIFALTYVGDRLIGTLRSPDQDQGYPGNLDMKVTYWLDEASLIIELEAESDQDTLFDATQHTYFNLNRDHASTIRNHTLKLNSKCLYTIDESGCTCDVTLDTTGTDFDFSIERNLGTCLDADHPQLVLNRGLDNYFIKDDQDKPYFCTLSAEGLQLEVLTSHMGAHIYSGNYLQPLDANSKYPFMQENGGICFETQHIPNSINFDRANAPILKASKRITSQTIYRFKEETNQ